MYHWIAAIAPRRMTGYLSFVTGWCTVFGCGFKRHFSVDNKLTQTRDLHGRIDKSDLLAEFHGIDRIVPQRSRDQGLDDIHCIPGLELGYGINRPLGE
jgi:hypothetical protein